MTRFLQIHTLHSYPASLLNRDDVGLAKRIPFGGSERVRISSQCLKRHWRTADDELALGKIPLAEGVVASLSIRSRRTFAELILKRLLQEGVQADVARGAVEELRDAVLGKSERAAQKKEKRGKGRASTDDVAIDETAGRTDQVVVLGAPEVRYLADLARECVSGAADEDAARAAVRARFDEKGAHREKGKALKQNLEALRLHAGLDAAMFGRMTTGDVLARCDAAIHVAHAFTVHRGFTETDYFSAIDDLQPREETGSGHINTSELASGVFYGFVVVDVPLLVSNLEGCERGKWREADRTLASESVRRLVQLIAKVSPGAKLGSTAPYAHAHLVLAEAGDEQPRSLANAFLRAVGGEDILGQTYAALTDHVTALDGMYGRTTRRQLAAIGAPQALFETVDARATLQDLAAWVGQCVTE